MTRLQQCTRGIPPSLEAEPGFSSNPCSSEQQGHSQQKYIYPQPYAFTHS